MHAGKVGMSVLTKGLAMDFIRQGHSEMAITSIWPASAIQSAATEFHSDGSDSRLQDLRKPVGAELKDLCSSSRLPLSQC